MKRAFLVGIFVSIAAVPLVRGQSSDNAKPNITNSTGGTYHGGPGSMLIYDWSVGEVTMVSTFSDGGTTLTQGLLQNEIAIEPSGVANEHLAANLKIYPNPASTEVNIQFTSAAEGKLIYRLLDLNGKIITSGSANVNAGTSTQQVNVTGLAAATYMLQVSFKTGDNAEESTSYKIEKIK